MTDTAKLRAPCQHEKYDSHYIDDPDDEYGGMLCSGGHPVEGGEKVWWCETHETSNRVNTLGCWIGYDLWNASEGRSDPGCRMVERFLIPLPNTVDHPTVLDFWRHEPPKPYSCWVCGVVTDWIYLDIGHQHPDCEMYPTEEGDVVVVGGVQVSGPLIPLCETCSGLAVRTGNDPYAVCQKCNGTGLAPKPEREKSNE